MSTPTRAWSVAGLVAGVAGLAASYVTATLLAIRESPVVAVAETVVSLTPGPVAEFLIGLVGRADKPLLIGGVVLVVVALLAGAGRLVRRRWWGAVAVLVVLAVVGGAAVLTRRATGTGDLVPVVVGLAVWLVALSVLTEPLRRADSALAAGADAPPAGSRRSFLVAVGAIAGVSAVASVAGRLAGSGRRAVEQSRALLRVRGVSEPSVPASVDLGVDGASPWLTPATDFYRIDTSLAPPAIEPSEWRLRIHGMVDRELDLGFDDLVARERTQAWITLSCVSNTVGGTLVGNAWWSGVRLADLLDEAGVSPDADALLQTSDDGWTCGTPLSVVTDGREAMLAVAMNGKPLPIEHGFPVRTVVPGLYGYVSATKWVVDIEVTRFADFAAYWTERGWGEQGPVKTASRIDVPRAGSSVPAGTVRVAGVAWKQGTGIEAVEVAVDGGAWQPAELAPVPGEDTWVPWLAQVDLSAGQHELRVRATDADGEVQTGVQRDVLPDGATGWHTVDVTAE